ncbi:hypothetical protein K457DRAFT_26153 [Linnemannia elongata AG-77]|uniref:Uncharacterized protein n=1 Tax=Linnemannia elongata AG-77 TaxID=1314771 RepID=A0A197JB48_9FUNG|nr:hypothetical protein K457DRAFT_26153 [Linnemannia elongata AG-77]
MKLAVLVATFTASVVSALPMGNTTLSTSWAPRGRAAPTAAGCLSTTLLWGVQRMTPYPDGTPRVKNTFVLFIETSKDYITKLGHITREYGRDYQQCDTKGLICVRFDGWREKNPRVAMNYNLKWYHHTIENGKNADGPVGPARETFEYWDCVD